MIYKQLCKQCNKYYEGQGKYFCSYKCRGENRFKGFFIKCNQCYQVFSIPIYRKNTAKFCSRKCHALWKSNNQRGKNNPFYGKHHSKKTREKMSGNNNHGWRGGLPYCKCGKQLRDYRNKQCQKCILIAKKYLENLVSFKQGKNNPSWRGGKPKCLDCNKLLSRYDAQRCGRCSLAYKVKENHSCWRGGISFEPYSTEFNNQLKQEIRHRDNYTCQKCFRLQKEELQEFGRKLSIHHIDYNKRNCEKTNLITMCLKCNAKVNSSRSYWTSYFTNLIDLLDWT